MRLLTFEDVNDRYIKLLTICKQNNLPAHIEQLMIINCITSHSLLGDITETESMDLIMDYLNQYRKEKGGI